MAETRGGSRALIVAWAVGGVVLLLLKAIVGLTPLALQALAMPLTGGHWVALALWVAFMVYTEAWRGFHKQFSPRVVARALHLADHPRPLHVALAPMFAMGMIHATRKRLIVAWGLVFGIVTLVVLLRFVPQPWRGIVDTGVVLGLLLGALSIGWHLARALGGHPPDIASDVPAAGASAAG